MRKHQWWRQRPAFTEENFWALYLPFALGFVFAYVAGAVAVAVQLATGW
jgi:hypothetical protein